MTLKPRDRKALVLLGGAVAVWGILQLAWPAPGEAPAVAPSAETISSAQKRLARLRVLAASVPGHEQTLKQAQAELAQREKALIPGQTGPQAQAHLLEILRRLAKAQNPPLELKGLDLGQMRKLTDDYGEVLASSSFECDIVSLLNLLSGLTAQPEALAVTDLQVASGNAKQKTVKVRLTVSGLVARKLIPEKKGFTF